MGKIKAVVLIFALIIVLTGCQPKKEGLPSFSDGAFACEASWVCEGKTVRAEISAGEIRSDGLPRDLSIAFSEPRAMSGITVCRKDGKISAFIDGLTWEGEYLRGWLGTEALFETDGDIIGSFPETLNGDTVRHLTLKRTDGENTEMYLSSAGGLPVKLCGKVNGKYTEVTILRFEKK